MEIRVQDSKRWMGARLERKEDLRLVTGQGKYLADIVLPGMLHAVFVRSEYAHARITGIDTSAAKALPGVVDIITGEEMRHHVKSMRQPVLLPNLPAKYPEYWALAVDKVKYHGDPVAVVIARDKYVAEDAAELVVVDYEELPVVVDAEAALAPAAVKVHDEEADNEIRALGGVTADEELSDSVIETARLRFSWLFVNLLTALLASAVIGLFEGALQKMVALAVLMPIVASQGGNAATQTMTVAVRALATRTLGGANAPRVVRREMLVGLLNGLAFAAVLGVVAALWFKNAELGVVIGVAVVVNLVAAGLAGVLIPLALDRYDIDPAVASGPFVTTVTDIVGFFAFLGVATLWFGLGS